MSPSDLIDPSLLHNHVDKYDLDNLDDSIDIYPFFSERMKEWVNKLEPDLVGISEEELKTRYTPTRTDELLRTNLWAELNRVAGTSISTISLRKVCASIMSESAFYTRVVNNPLRLSFLLIPPIRYKLHMANLLDKSLNKLYEILNLDIMKPDGTPNAPLISAIVKAALTIRDVQKGAAIQRNLNLNMEGGRIATPPDEIDKRIQDLKDKLNVVKVESQVDEGSGVTPGFVEEQEDGKRYMKNYKGPGYG